MSVSQINCSTRFSDVPNGTTAPYPVPAPKRREVCYMQPDGARKSAGELAAGSVKGGLTSGKKVGAASTVVNLMSGKNIFENEVSLDILRASGSFFAAKTARNLVRSATEGVTGQTAIRTATGFTANAMRKAYQGEGYTGIALGGVVGAAYELLAEAQDELTRQGRTDLSFAAGVAGTYAIELGAAAVLCYTDPLIPCPVHVAKAAVAATILVVV